MLFIKQLPFLNAEKILREKETDSEMTEGLYSTIEMRKRNYAKGKYTPAYNQYDTLMTCWFYYANIFAP